LPTIRNFGRTWRFSPAAIATPATLAELVEVVRGATKLRVMGARHSWSRAIVTDGTVVSLDKLDRVIAVDKSALRVTVQGGIKLHALIRALAAHGLALANLGSIADQSLAGAMATATHGTGIRFQCLASQVASFRIVDGTGRDRTYTRDDAAFHAILTGLGAFGVIHELTLEVRRAFQIHAITDTAPLQHVIDHLDDYVRGFDHFKLWWMVPCERAVVFTNNRTEAARNDSAVARWLRDDLLSVVAYRSLVALGKLNRAALVPRINAMLTGQVGKRFERICASPIGFLTPAPPVHREAEWAFDLASARELLTAYRALLVGSGHTFNFIQEIRFTRADEFWLSPAYRRDTMWLSLYNMASDERWADQLRQFEAFARAHGGRPHWGKEASFDATYLRTQYEQLPAFRALVGELDPRGVFTNPWLAGILDT
jgi:FAD/FMN-containing dehydrogenase